MPGSNNNSQINDVFEEDNSYKLPEVLVNGNIIFRPFYYDRELSNDLTYVSLHANSKLVKDEKTDEVRWVTDPTKLNELLDSDNYISTPLCRSVLNEDYSINVSNSWTQFGDDAIGSAFNSLKPFAPYAAKLAGAADIMLSKSKNMELTGDKAMDSSFGRVMTKLASYVKDSSDKGAKILNRSLVAQGARFSYYSGTGVGFGNLSMKFTVFSEYKQDTVTGKVEWMDVNSQLQNLYPYVMGKYTNGILNSDGSVKGIDDIKTGVSGETAEVINEFFSWQLPPGGYNPDTVNYDKVQHGTLKLKIGAFYSIPSLVCINSQFQFSKQMVKNWDLDKKKNTISPLYCDVVLTFQPVVKYSDDALKKLMSGSSQEISINSVKERLSEKLKSIREEDSYGEK